MPAPPPPQVPTVVAPPPPERLADPWTVIGVGTLAWLAVTAAAFATPGLESWRPVCLAGLGIGALGTGIFLWQRSAARRGARGAQTGLSTETR